MLFLLDGSSSKNEKSLSILPNFSTFKMDSSANLDRVPFQSFSNLSGTLPTETEKSNVFKNNMNNQRKSTMGFFYPSISARNSELFMSKIHKFETKNSPKTISEVKKDGNLSTGNKIKSSKPKEIYMILNNKEIKKKELHLQRLLTSKLQTNHKNFIQNISNLKINCTDAGVTSSSFLNNNKTLTPKTPLQDKTLFFSLSRLHEKRKIKSPYDQNRDYYIEKAQRPSSKK